MTVMALLHLDTEFLESGPDEPLRLISIGLVAHDSGAEYYAINADFDRSLATPWLAEHVLPHLDADDAPTPLPRSVIASEVAAFVAEVCGGRKPQFSAWSGAYDWVLLNGLFGRMVDHPDGWPKHFTDLREWAGRLGNPTVPAQTERLHHALYDARHDRFAHGWLAAYEAERRLKRDRRLRDRIVAEMTAAARATDLR